jgi:hypothetical protein
MRKQSLLDVADAIEAGAVADLGFNMALCVSDELPDRSGRGCGTVGCVAGWAVTVLDSDGKRHTTPLSASALSVAYNSVVWQRGRDRLGLTEEQADWLFLGRWHKSSRTDGVKIGLITPAEAVAELRRLAAQEATDA